MFESGARYAASTASTTSGSGGAGANAGAARAGSAGERRVRVVRLLRPRRSAPAFGFSVRGGREHAAGFFISKVEPNSEAHHQGLKVGDQLVSVNGFRVDDAVHAELTHYITAQARLSIKVRNVGMLPVKEKSHEPLTWQFVSESASLASDTTASSSPTLCDDRFKEVHLSLLVPPKAKLGCGICKGPEWKPGIFVQFIKEHGIARDSGLRPGDQILFCNGIDFRDIQFNEAITVMKQPGRLELRVRAGAGCELVSPESSGYNSSASSAAGERSPPAPPAALRQRLASVAEEAADRVDRLTMNRLKRRTWDSIDFDWKSRDVHSFDAPSDIEPDYDSPSIPNNPHTYDNYRKNLRKTDFVSNPSNRTIINLTENGATIQCSYDHPTQGKGTFSNAQYQGTGDKDKKTIVVEVHHTSGPQNASTKNCNKNLPTRTHEKEMSTDTTSMSSSTTLSSAIHEEIQRRKKRQDGPETVSMPSVNITPKNVVLKTVDSEKKKQHDALMDEFKKVHQKMFACQENSQNRDIKLDGEEKDRYNTFPSWKTPQIPVKVNGVNDNGEVPAARPPPPPPMPAAENGEHKNGSSDTKDEKVFSPLVKNGNATLTNKLNGITIPNGTAIHNVAAVQNGTVNQNGMLKRIPTPDYETTKIQALTAQLKLSNGPKEDLAELESLESYTLKNPSSPQPKPPPTYFKRPPNGTATMKKHARPVSVTIGEYPSNSIRRNPSKLEFLNGENKTNGVDVVDNTQLGSRLQSELALTLSRSNLRKKTDALDPKIKDSSTFENSKDGEESDQSVDKNFRARYGNNILPISPLVTIPKVSGLKSNVIEKNSNAASLSRLISNTTCHNGILKETSGNCHVPRLDSEKKISFDQVLMAVGDK